jgi:hypothetical protein
MRFIERLIVVLAILVLPLSAVSEPTPAPSTKVEDPTTMVDRVEEAMLYIVTKGIPEHRIYPNKGNVIVKDKEWRRELATAIVAASRQYEIPWSFMVALSFREGSFQKKPVGKIGEQSTFQIVEDTAEAFQCDMDTVAGSASCAAKILRHWQEKCGSLRGGFMRYATGRSICYPDTKRLKWLHRDRPGIADILEERFGASDEALGG